MRKTFINTLVDLADHDQRIVLLTGDLGFMVLEPFIERFRDRFFNVGVAEQNMIGVATGLAEAGFFPFCYSIATFATLRPYEFIRNGPVLHHLPVRIVGVGGGFEYGAAGPTHHGLEDIGVMRLQPGLTTIAPADYEQTRTALLNTWDLPGPIYYRLGKNDRDTLPGLNGQFASGQANLVSPAEDVLFITMGSLATEVVSAADALRTDGIEAGVLVVASINPPPIEDLINAIQATKLVVTAEAHFINGGVGSLVAEVMADHQLNTPLIRCGVNQVRSGISGSTTFLRQQHGLDQHSLAEKVRQTLSELA